MNPSANQPQSTKQQVVGTISGLGGAAVGVYAGVNLLIPLIFTGAAWWVALRLLPETKKLVIPAFAVQVGHCLWFSLAFALLGTVNENELDVLLLIGGLIWLVARPGFGPLYLLGVYHLFSVVYNGYIFYESAVGSNAHKALLVHIIWRSLALFFMAQLFFKLRKAKTGAAVAP